jgi:hypothetical protein
MTGQSSVLGRVRETLGEPHTMAALHPPFPWACHAVRQRPSGPLSYNRRRADTHAQEVAGLTRDSARRREETEKCRI